jgi:hypothetical protein
MTLDLFRPIGMGISQVLVVVHRHVVDAVIVPGDNTDDAMQPLIAMRAFRALPLGRRRLQRA